MEINYNKLKGRIKEIFGLQKAFAHAMGITEQALTYKLKPCGKWNTHEIEKARILLELSVEDIPAYFFNR